MAAPDQAPSLSKREMQRTLGCVRKRSMKAALCNPYSVVWPGVPKSDGQFVLELLNRDFSACELRKTSQIMRKDRHTEYKDFKKFKRQQKIEHMIKLKAGRGTEEVNLMSQLVLGFQKVNKSLERDGLRLVLATRESWLLIQHLAMLVGIRRCPGMALPGLEEHVAGKLGVSKLSVLGFKKKRPGDSDRFDDLVSSIAVRCPQIDIPWAELETESTAVKEPEPQTGNRRPPLDYMFTGNLRDVMDEARQRALSRIMPAGADSFVEPLEANSPDALDHSDEDSVHAEDRLGDSDSDADHWRPAGADSFIGPREAEDSLQAEDRWSASEALHWRGLLARNLRPGADSFVGPLEAVHQRNRQLMRTAAAATETPQTSRTTTTAVETTTNQENSEDSVSYAHLYKYKADTQKRQTIIFEKKNSGEFVSAKQEGIDDLDFVALEEGGTDIKTKKRKNKDKSQGKMKKRKKSKSSSWQEMDVGRMVPNANRKTGRKKK